MQPRINDLIIAIRDSLPSIPVRVPGRGLEMSWPRPPLQTGQRLAGVDLAPFAEVEVDMDLSQLRGVFEEFVAQALDDGFQANSFFRSRLGLHDRVIDWLFPVEVTKPYIHLAVFLNVIHTSVKGSLLVMDMGNCLIQCDGIEFGVKNCGILSKFTTGVLEPFDYTAALAVHHTYAPPRVSSRSALSGFYRHAFNISNSELRYRVQLALQYLFYRYDHLGRLTDYLYAGMTPRNKNGFPKKAAAVGLDKRLTSVGNLMPTIYRELVESGLIEKEEFAAVFSKADEEWRHQHQDAIVDPETLMSWHKSLRKIGVKQ